MNVKNVFTAFHKPLFNLCLPGTWDSSEAIFVEMADADGRPELPRFLQKVQIDGQATYK